MCVPVNWPILVPSGVPVLDTAIKSTSGSIIVFGFSEGAQVAEQWVIQHANDLNAPSSANLTFVVIGNSTRAHGGSLNSGPGSFGEVWPQSRYQVIDVAREYDYAADFPNNPSSPYFLLAVFNALAGGLGTHDYSGVNLNDPANTVWTVGNITYVLAPTQNLPLADGLRVVGLTALADQLQAQLKPLVDQAYNRNYPGLIQPGVITSQPAPAAISPAAAASTLSVSVASDPTVASQDTAVPLSLASTPPGDSAPTSTGPKKVNGTGPAAADAVTTTTPPGRADVLDTVETNTPPAAQTDLDNATAAKQSTTAPTTRTTATSITDGNKVVPGKAGGNKAATNSGDQATSTKEGERSTSTKDTEKSANSDG
jgi:diacyltrehalose acyltransferase